MTASTSQETAALLAGRPPGVTVQFNKYIFDQETSLLLSGQMDEEEKENCFPPAKNETTSCKTSVQRSYPTLTSSRPATDFLREVEKIFLGDIAGTGDLVPSDAVLSNINPR